MNNKNTADHNNRKNWLDCLRAVAMLLVIMGHILTGSNHELFYVITSPVKIPLFFIISGYLFHSCRNDSFDVFIRKTITRLIIPLLVFSVILCPVKVLAAKLGLIDHSVSYVIRNFLTGNEYWYLTCYILCEVIFFVVVKNIKKITGINCAVIVLSVIGIVITERFSLQSFGINTVLIALFYLLIGYDYRILEEKITKYDFVSYVLLGVYAALIIYSVNKYSTAYIDVHNNKYYDYPLNMSLIFIGNIGLFALFRKLNIQSGMLEFIGKNTLTIYLLHEYFVVFLKLVLRKAFGIKIINCFYGILILCCVLVIMYPICIIINRYAPWSVGKKRKLS